MKRILAAIEQRTREFEAHPFHAFLKDESRSARERLSFAPLMTHFVMTFADLYAMVLREEPPSDELQAIVNAHTREDGGHWKWFLADLGKLGSDPRMPFSDSMRFVWGEGTARMRMLSYRMCRLGMGADSLHKLVLVQCIEATGASTLRNVAPVGRAIGEEVGKPLVYFGPHHFETESDHTLEEDDVRKRIGAIEVDPGVAEELLALVDETFRLFTEGADEILAFVKGGARFGGGEPIAAE